LKHRVELSACGNTMRAQNVTLKNLLPGFVSAEQGGVVRLAELQAEGYAYRRPRASRPGRRVPAGRQ